MTSTTQHAPHRRYPLLNIHLDDLTMDELLARFDRGFVWTPNVDCMVKLHDSPTFVEAVQDADYICADGKIVCWGARFMGTPLREKVSGSDLFPAYCDYHRHNNDIRIFLLGAGPGVAAKAAENINHRIGREIIVSAHSPSMNFLEDTEECTRVIEMINKSGANVLGVGLGAPKQEIWIHRYHKQLNTIHSFMALGATIDFEAGTVKRAPRWMSDIGMEWLYRLIIEPRRLWYRYLVYDMRFFWLLLKQRLGLYQPPKINS